ncbi:MAG: DUF4382 domain-containing protein [Candidatus Diapherotrites archaeon]
MNNLLIVGLIFLVLFFAGCIVPPEPIPLEKTGKLSLSITDKKVDGLEELHVTISSVEVHGVLPGLIAVSDENSNGNAGENGAENSGWFLFSSEERTFDIMALDSTQGLKEIIGEKELSAGKYTQIRLMVKEVKAVINGEEVDVEVPSEKIKLVSTFEIKEDETTELIIDFSSESVIQSGNGYKLKPVIKLLTEKEFRERNQNLDKEKYCEERADCACGVRKGTEECFFGNKEYVDTQIQCPDFCTGVSAGLTIDCVNNKCVQRVKQISQERASQLAQNSECAQNGILQQTANYNGETKTWWIDLEATEPQEGCNPACVVSEDETVEINWRCTGLIIPDKCAEEGDKFSKVYTEDYPENCCEGLTEWNSGFDTRISVAGNCYETGMESGSPVGTCINCGDRVCGLKENSCNCPADCVGGEYSDYTTLDEFCASGLYNTIINHCSQVSGTDELCALAETCPESE